MQIQHTQPIDGGGDDGAEVRPELFLHALYQHAHHFHASRGHLQNKQRVKFHTFHFILNFLLLQHKTIHIRIVNFIRICFFLQFTT